MNVRVRKPAAQRRKEIARAVLRIVGQRGATALTTAALAEDVGLTSGALFRHFDSRDAMLQEAVRFAVERIEKTFPDRSRPPVERLLGLADNRVRLLRADPGLAWLLRSEQASLMLPPDAVERLRLLVDRSRRFLLEAIREGMAAGAIRDDIEPEVLLVVVMGTIHGLVGMPGPHGSPRVRTRGFGERALEGLQRMLAPEVGPRRRGER